MIYADGRHVPFSPQQEYRLGKRFPNLLKGLRSTKANPITIPLIVLNNLRWHRPFKILN